MSMGVLAGDITVHVVGEMEPTTSSLTLQLDDARTGEHIQNVTEVRNVGGKLHVMPILENMSLVREKF